MEERDVESEFVDPAAGTREAVIAFLRGRGPVQAHVVALAVGEAAYEILRQLRSEGILTRQTVEDRKVWSLAAEPVPEIVEDAAAEVVEPSVVDAREEAEPVAPGASLTNRTTVAQLVAVFQRAEADIRAAFAQITRAEDTLNSAFTLGSDRPFGVEVSCHHGQDFANPEPAIEKLRRKAWETIVERLEVKRAMSFERAVKLDKHLAESTPEPITEATVNAFVRRFVETLDEMFEAAVVEVFDWLRPHAGSFRDSYKTNQKNGRLEVGERLILTGMVRGSWGDRHPFDVQYGYGSGHASPSDRLTALWNVFSMLDGKGIGEKTNKSPLENAISTSPDGKGRTLYFEFSCHKNGNLHLHFLRPDLLKRFNQIAGGKRLRPEAA